MKIWAYSSYEEYVNAQKEANHRKINHVWIEPKTISKIKKYIPHADSILCHGTRNGKELELFSKEYSPSFIIGTEISDTAIKFENTIEHDFHEVCEDWIERFDIVYSNSFDHSYDPIKCLNTWKNQINKNGLLIVELGLNVANRSRASDPLEITEEEFVKLCNSLNLFVKHKEEGNILGGKLSSMIYFLSCQDFCS